MEAEFGRPDEARQLAKASLNGVYSPEAQAVAALALARSGDVSAAETIVSDLAQRFPSDTLLHALDLPTIRPAIEMSSGNPGAAIRLPSRTGLPPRWRR